MGLSAGTRLGHYEVQAQIGAGGMGEVYRALDFELGREVALKLLPSKFSRDPERLARFKREAKLLASLNHPNIAAIYGLEKSDDTHFLVLELVEGETLHKRLQRRGAVPPEESLDIARQICEALEHAHEKNIIHRDLKPANVKLTPEGLVKVLDFGLAKAFSPETPQRLDSDVSTLSHLSTMEGQILGTPAYMSPEQAQGKTVDKRADIWSFGCLFYELLTAKRAFPGENTTQIIAAVLRAEPDWQALPPETPETVREILERCLEKGLGNRWRDIGDVRVELEKTLRGAPKTEPVPVAVSPRSLRHKLVWSVVALALLAIATAAVWYLKPTPAQPLMRLNMNVSPAEHLDLAVLQCPVVTLSPDGSRVAFIGTRQGNRQLFVRTIESPEAEPVAGTEGAFCAPAFSPDGQWLVFYSDGNLKKVPYTGGTPILVASIGGMAGSSWGDDGNIVFSSGPRGLRRVSASGGPVEYITTTDTENGERTHTYLQVLPGAKAVVYTVVMSERPDDSRIVTERLDTDERRVLIQGGTYPSYVPSGYLVFLRGGVMMAVPFDSERLEIVGNPLPVGEQVL